MWWNVNVYEHYATSRISVPLSTLQLLAARYCTFLPCTCIAQPLANDSYRITCEPCCIFLYFLVSFTELQYLFSQVRKAIMFYLVFISLCLVLEIVPKQRTDINLGFTIVYFPLLINQSSARLLVDPYLERVALYYVQFYSIFLRARWLFGTCHCITNRNRSLLTFLCFSKCDFQVLLLLLLSLLKN